MYYGWGHYNKYITAVNCQVMGMRVETICTNYQIASLGVYRLPLAIQLFLPGYLNLLIYDYMPRKIYAECL